jgi:O-6-methylguanine DNA methyltransferase
VIFEYGKVKGLNGLVVVVKEQKKIKAIYPFLCEKMGADFCVSYVGSIWGKPDNIKNKRTVDLNKIELGDIDLDGVNSFAKKVYQKLYSTKKGTLLSYGELAAKAGKPKAARAVGTLMKKNSFPIVVPCHRVYAKSGAEHFSITCLNKRPALCADKTRKSLCECAEKIKLSLRDAENE